MKTFRHIITSVTLMLFIISFSVTFTLNFRPLYYFDIGYLNIEGLSGLDADEIRENYDALIDYNAITGPDTLTFPTLDMSESGRIHFEEVKRIFITLEYMMLITALMSVILIIISIKKYKDCFFLKLTAILTIVIPVILGLLISLNWSKAFVVFHHIFFNNDYWIFSPETDPVINILPDTFFLHCAAMILILVIIGSMICGMIYTLQKKNPDLRP
ncbi:MAG: TIGR01906 family membrane protein [Lachnospiraceae bacterium]|nr:TIGR01906 family membrane protein [Lachnospiraceae bacterium]